MVADVNSLFNAVGTIAGLLRPLRASIKRASGMRRSLLVVLELNNRPILLHTMHGLSAEEAQN